MKRRLRSTTPALTLAQLDALLEHLDAHGALEGCDNTLKVTREWLAGRVPDPGAAVRWLQARGGYCDCEVMLNVPAHVVPEAPSPPTLWN